MNSQFIVAGASGDLGKEFIRQLTPLGEIIGMSRKNNPQAQAYTHISADFNDQKSIELAFEKIPKANNVYYFHLIGAFRFEDEAHPITDINNDGLDDMVYESNLKTFQNVIPSLKKQLKNNPIQKLTIIGIGSASDIYEIPFWQSFTKAKNQLRAEFRKLYGEIENYGRIKTCIINVSTVTGTQLASERPYLRLDYCLSPKEVVTSALPYILDEKGGSIEVTIIKPNPDFNNEFLVLENIKKRWYQDMHNKLI
jgi:nucleoside-diphosphate-sugar epimerase